MSFFNNESLQHFLLNYWQKKPMLIRQAIPLFKNPLNGDELAGLALEEEIESRMVWQTLKPEPTWYLKRGPFDEDDFNNLPSSHWTLLVQGVDRFVPEVAALRKLFHFIPGWRFDDVMISYALKEGGVGPHYDNYDVFLFQAKGKRHWSLTTQDCTPENYTPGLDLRIMKKFVIEEEYILEEGDMLYLPPHVGHNGVALDNDCITYSFGYRSYQAKELLNNLADHVHHFASQALLYQDPLWTPQIGNEITEDSFKNAACLLQKFLQDELAFKKWFGCFATMLDQQAELLLPTKTKKAMGSFLKQLKSRTRLIQNPVCRFAYYQEPSWQLFINGEPWPVGDVSRNFLKLVVDNQENSIADLIHYLDEQINLDFLYALWQHNYVELVK